MSKQSYFIKYRKEDPTGVLSLGTHKIRAVSEKEALARFVRWDNHRPDAAEYAIEKYWIERVG